MKAPPCSGASFDIRAGIALPGAHHRPPDLMHSALSGSTDPSILGKVLLALPPARVPCHGSRGTHSRKPSQMDPALC